MSWYKEGSVNIEQGSKTVTGIGTKWTNPLIGVCTGQMLILKTANAIEIYEIASVQSDTQLTLANQYSGASKTGVSYEIPTSPSVSIENLALRISEMLNYYQLQMEGWQSILTGTGDVTLTAPDGRVVTIKSQRALTEAINNSVKSGSEFPYHGYLDNTDIGNLGAVNLGVYVQNLDGKALPELHYPTTMAGTLTVLPTYVGGNGCVQIYTTSNSRQFIRNYVGGFNGGTWGPWVEQIYIVESYRNGDSWYNAYSNGFIEQSGIISVNTDVIQEAKGTAINLLKPMKTNNYGVSVDLYARGGPWGWVKFACGSTDFNSFVLFSYTDINPGTNLIRWTVRGY